MQGRDAELGGDDRKILIELDNFLNLVEYVLYLEEKGQIDSADRDALLQYWTELLQDADRSALRYYLSGYGYERVAKLAKVQNDTYLVLYGSLRRGLPQFTQLGLDTALEFLGSGLIRATR